MYSLTQKKMMKISTPSWNSSVRTKFLVLSRSMMLWLSTSALLMKCQSSLMSSLSLRVTTSDWTFLTALQSISLLDTTVEEEEEEEGKEERMVT